MGKSLSSTHKASNEAGSISPEKNTATLFIDSVLSIPILSSLGVLNSIWSRQVYYVNDRKKLYSIGHRILNRANRSISVFSTLRGEAPERDASDEVVHYRRALHLLAMQSNQFGSGSKISVERYVDLRDQHKANEALVLLLWGQNVKVRYSTFPIEILIRDGEELLMGFPSEGVLVAGIHSSNASLIQAVESWISVHTRAESGAPITSPLRLVQKRCEMLDAETSEDDLYAPLEKLGVDDNYEESLRSTFDVFSSYRNLYGREVSRFYNGLRGELLHRFSREPSIQFLDCGCGPAIGCEELVGNSEGNPKIVYIGVDLSGEERFKKNQYIVIDNYISLVLEASLAKHRMLRKKIARTRKAIQLIQNLHMVAFQGNTFDYLLGYEQKEIVIRSLYDLIVPGGLLLVTGQSYFNNDGSLREEILSVDGKSLHIKVKWAGTFGKILNHHMYPERLRETLNGLYINPMKMQDLVQLMSNCGFSYFPGFEREWFGPVDREPYYFKCFERTK